MMPGGTARYRGRRKGLRKKEKIRILIRNVPWNVECSHILTKLRIINRLLCTLIYPLKASNSVVATGGRLSRTQSRLLTI